MDRAETIASHLEQARCLPKRVIIFRHAEREDHKRPEWARTATRPHDGPLSRNGKAQSRALGAALRAYVDPDTDTPVLFSSPFVRCVITISTALGELYKDRDCAPPHLNIEPYFSERGVNVYTRMSRTHAQLANQGVPGKRCEPVVFSPGDLMCVHEHINEGYKAVAELDYDAEGKQVPYLLQTRLDQWTEPVFSQPFIAGKTIICASHGGVATEICKHLTKTTPRFKTGYAQFFVLDLDPETGRYVHTAEWHPEDVQLEQY